MTKYIVFKSDSKTGATKFLIRLAEKENNKFVKQWSESIHEAYVFSNFDAAQNYANLKKALVSNEVHFPELKKGIENLSVNISVDASELQKEINKIVEKSVEVRKEHTEDYWQNRISDNLKAELEKESEKLIVKHVKKVFAWIKSRFGKKN